jgi:hypothetical protein
MSTSTPSLRPCLIFAWARTRGRPLRTIAKEVPKAKRCRPSITEVLTTIETASSTNSNEDDNSWASADFSGLGDPGALHHFIGVCDYLLDNGDSDDDGYELT